MRGDASYNEVCAFGKRHGGRRNDETASGRAGCIVRFRAGVVRFCTWVVEGIAPSMPRGNPISRQAPLIFRSSL
jgi:hypothetical protein